MRISPDLKNNAERVLATFGEGFFSSLTLSAAFNLSALESASLAGLAAVYALVKVMVVGRIKASQKASLPAVPPPPEKS